MGAADSVLKGVLAQAGKPRPVLSIDDRIKERRQEDRSHAIREVIDAWKEQADQERTLRRSYGNWLLIGLGVQCLLINAAFFLIGFESITVDEWTARTFILAAFAEIGGMVWFVVKHLFKDYTKDVFGLLQDL